MPLTHDIGVRIPYPLQKVLKSSTLFFFAAISQLVTYLQPSSENRGKEGGEMMRRLRENIRRQSTDYRPTQLLNLPKTFHASTNAKRYR